MNVFVRGARKPSSRFAASSECFAFGEFKLSHGTSAYYLNDADISNYFEEFRTDIELASYASYFAEIADYYCVEGDDATPMLGLLYASFLALNNPNFTKRLVRCIFVLRAIVLNGEFPGLPAGRDACLETPAGAFLTDVHTGPSFAQEGYRYEYPLVIAREEGGEDSASVGDEDYCEFHPDFYCLNVRTRQEYAWEHLGMMDDESYAARAVEKLALYSANGYFPGKNLIITMETKKAQISSQEITRLINEYLK